VAYLAEIQLAVKGAKQLKDLSNTIEATSKKVDRLARDIQTLSEGGIPRTINNLRNIVRQAADAFDAVALNTKDASDAARDYYQANKTLNNALRERVKLLNDIQTAERGTVLANIKASQAARTASNFAAFSAGIENTTAVQKSIRRNAQRTASLPKAAIEATPLMLPAFQERGLQLLNDSIKLNASQLNLERALNGERARGVRYLEKQTAEEARQVRQGLLPQRTNRLPGIGTAPAAAAAAPGQFPVSGPMDLRGRFGQTMLPGSQAAARTGMGGFIGALIPSALISASFPILTGQGIEAGIGGGIGGLIGGGLGSLLGPGGMMMGSFAGGLVGSIIGERIGEARKLTEELTKQQDVVKAINGLEERRSALTVDIAKAQQQNNDALAIELERRQQNNKIAQELFETITKLEADERNKTKEGQALVELEKQRAYQAANRAVNENNVLTALRQQQDLINKQVQASDMLAERRMASISVQTTLAEQQTSIATARFDAFMKINDLELQRARNAGDTAKEYQLQLDRANLIYQQTVLQVEQELQRNKLAAIREKIELLRLQSEVKVREQAGENVLLLKQAVDLQTQAVQLAFQGVAAAQQIAQYQITGAQAVRQMAIEQAAFNRAAQTGVGGGGGALPMGGGGALPMGGGGQGVTVTSTATTRSISSATPEQLARSLSAQGFSGIFTEAQAAAALRGKYDERVAKFQAATIGTQGYSAIPSERQLEAAGFAEGGFVTRPTNAMVGEGGQPEYVIPASKMNDAMRRYSAGTRGEAVITGAGAPGASNSSANYTNQQNTYYGSGGGTSVNITTGPVLRMNNKNYVSVSDMQRGLAAAVGAAESNMINRMSRSYAARRSMGL